MNKTLARKYLSMVADSAPIAHECHAQKRKCPYAQTEFDFVGGQAQKPAVAAPREDKAFLERFSRWIDGVHDTKTVADVMHKYDDGNHPELMKIINKAADRVIDYERCMSSLGERA